MLNPDRIDELFGKKDTVAVISKPPKASKPFRYQWGNNIFVPYDFEKFSIYCYGERIGFASTDIVEKMIASEWAAVWSE